MLVGDGPIRKMIEEMIKEENIEDKVIFTGNVKHDNVPKFIAAMDICVIPQSNEYRSPVKLFEYMAMSKPVIAPRLEPIELVVEHEKSGILFEQANENSFKEVLIYLMENNDEREKLAYLARKIIRQRSFQQ